MLCPGPPVELGSDTAAASTSSGVREGMALTAHDELLIPPLHMAVVARIAASNSSNFRV
jgi:hypothetical protein